jgi:hypothetical protein
MHDNLHCYTALAGKDFDALIDSSETNRRRAISQREIILLSPPPTQCPDGLWRVGEFRWFDVALKITSDLLSARRYRRGVTIALPILQMKLIGKSTATPTCGSAWSSAIETKMTHMKSSSCSPGDCAALLDLDGNELVRQFSDEVHQQTGHRLVPVGFAPRSLN